ncbi:MAG: hypothetical protein WBV25_06920 [Methylocella sp.]
MGQEDDILALIDLIYETAFDSTLWPAALTRLADTTGTAQVGLASLDRRAHIYESIAPRTDPVMDARYKDYWAFHDPLWPLMTKQPPGTVFSLDSIMPRKEFSSTPVFNEWFRPAEFGLASMGSNLLVGDQVSALICVANTPKNDHINEKQTLAFKAALPHIDRAVRIHRELRIRDLDHDTAPARLECLQRSVMLVDGAARVLFANAAARTLLGSGGGLILRAGYLHSTGDSDIVQGLIASCTRKARAPRGPGGEMSIRRGPRRSPLRVTVTPLRSKGTIAELPWLGLGIPVAMVTVVDSAREKWMN